MIVAKATGLSPDLEDRLSNAARLLAYLNYFRPRDSNPLGLKDVPHLILERIRVIETLLHGLEGRRHTLCLPAISVVLEKITASSLI